MNPLIADVTILIPSFNPGKYLREAVESVFQQTYQNWKLIIVDDASTDNSLDSVNDLVKDPRVRVIRNPVNLGQSRTQNAGLEHVDTPFILMLDSDDWLFPYTVEILVEESKHITDDVALICGNKRIIYEDEEGNIIKKTTRESGRDFDDKYEFILANYIPYPRFYRTAALRKVGGWPTDDPYEGRYLEDQRMDHKLIEFYKIHWIDHMLYNYRRHTNNMSSKINLMNEMYEWLVKDSLERWGDYYLPVFEYSWGWLKLKELIQKNKEGI